MLAIGIATSEQLARDPLWGSLFENLVVLEAMKARLNRGLHPNLYYFRDSHGHEIDLILNAKRKLWTMEIKAGETFDTSFLRNLKFFKKLTQDKLGGSTVIFGGDQKRHGNDYRLISFADTAALINEHDLFKKTLLL